MKKRVPRFLILEALIIELIRTTPMKVALVSWLLILNVAVVSLLKQKRLVTFIVILVFLLLTVSIYLPVRIKISY